MRKLAMRDQQACKVIKACKGVTNEWHSDGR
jgi:hypothetical protein